MKFQVTEIDIVNGERGSTNNCPVANCIRRTLTEMGKEPVMVVVGGTENDWITLPEFDDYYFDMPGYMREIIGEYDSSGIFKPISFELSFYNEDTGEKRELK